jgi:hypothetical protein
MQKNKFLLSFLGIFLFAIFIYSPVFTIIKVNAETSSGVATPLPATDQKGFKKFINTIKQRFHKVNTKNLPANSHVTAAATNAILTSPQKAEKVPVYVHEINKEILQDGINLNSKSFFATEKFKQESKRALFNVLAERKKIILHLIQNGQADQVAKYAIPLLSQSLIPADAQNLIEKPKTISGQVAVLATDDFSDEHNGELYSYELVSGNKRLDFYPTTPVNVEPGENYNVRGMMLDNILIGEVTNPQNQNNEEADISNPEPSGLRVNVDHKTAVLLVKYNDAGADPFTKQDAGTKIFNGQFSNFYKEQSYQSITFSGDVFGWQSIPRATGSCDFPSFGWGGELDSMIATNGVNLANYEHVLIVTNCAGGFTKGQAYVGKNLISVNGTNYNISVSWVNGSGANFLQNSIYSSANTPSFAWTNLDATVSHEMGHALGMPEANGYDCGSLKLDTISFGNSSSCTKVLNGIPYDIMGNIKAYALHFNPFYKERAGWLDSTNMTTATTSGTYTLTPYETNTTGKKAVKIKMQNGTLTPYYVEWRKATGFDSTLSQSAFSSNQNGLIVTRAYSDSYPPYNTAALLDMRPTSSVWVDDTKTASLNSTSTFTDPRTGITIGPITSKTSSQIKFTVSIAPVACVRNNPIFQEVSPITIGPGNTFGFAQRVFNDDYTGCAASSMQVTMTLPNGFSASTNTGSMTTNAEAFSYIPLPAITASSSIAPGTYNITLQATNMASNKTATATIPVVVVI